MPYSRNSELPKSVKNNLPPAAQTIWRKAWNAAYQQYGSEETAARVAWAAVKKKYVKRGDKWVPKEDDTTIPNTQDAKWSRAKINNLPDAAFAHIESGGTKDADGKTTPRTLRHFPHHTSAVKNGSDHSTVDKPHLKNAFSRIGAGARFGKQAKPHLVRHAKALGVGDYESEHKEPDMDQLIEQLWTPITLSEQDDKGYYHASLLVTRGDFVNGNNRVYPMSIWNREVAKAQDKITQGRFVGLADHPGFFQGASVLNTVIKFEALRIEGREVWGDVLFIPTSKGQDVIALAQAGVQIGVSTRGRGTLKRAEEYSDPDGTIHKDVGIVQDDYEWSAADLVLNPSVADAGVYRFEHLADDEMLQIAETLTGEIAERATAPLQEQITELHSQIAALTESESVAVALREDATRQIDALNAHNDAVEQQYSDAVAERGALTGEVATLTTLSEDLQVQVENLTDARDMITDRSAARTYLREALRGDPRAWIVQGLLWDTTTIHEVNERLDDVRQEADTILAGQSSPPGRTILDDSDPVNASPDDTPPDDTPPDNQDPVSPEDHLLAVSAGLALPHTRR